MLSVDHPDPHQGRCSTLLLRIASTTARPWFRKRGRCLFPSSSDKDGQAMHVLSGLLNKANAFWYASCFNAVINEPPRYRIISSRHCLDAHAYNASTRSTNKGIDRQAKQVEEKQTWIVAALTAKTKEGVTLKSNAFHPRLDSQHLRLIACAVLPTAALLSKSLSITKRVDLLADRLVAEREGKIRTSRSA